MRHDLPPAAACSGLVRIYWSPSGEVHALKGVDAVLPAGRLTAITGPSGSGKSSLLRILAAQDPPTAGRAEVAGQSLAGLSVRGRRALRRRSIGYVFPRPPDNLLPHLTAREHLAAAARMRGTDGRDAADLLDLLGIAHRADHRPGQLSGGEQQRLAFAQAVVGRPPLVVADEPTSELDTATTVDLLDAVAALTATGTTVVVATHDPLAAGAADQVIHLRSGAVSHEEVGGRRLAVVDGEGRVQLPEAVLARFPARRVLIDVTDDGVVLRPPS
ncbi:ATP-binding cassette domain-containing protein [Geodermatophilus sabuli]|uniref:ATP-binding cassette domain-containing protein n=1 Tax=Geodermatophilus sabuli TaxID=1564158 RepID=A0A7K3W599_9ACTN|nr:ATP-binding cassette domain-containing protein [Geodermatophilus sabuli]NEK60049.1 ATP-binding cassette domain-containing protein [Geodermatophilus sabuli]